MDDFIGSCNAKTSTEFKTEMENLTSSLNAFNHKNDVMETEKLFNDITRNLLPRYSKNRVNSNTWMASPFIEFLPDQIVLLALSNAPIRCLAVIVKNDKDVAKDVLEGLQYSIMKISKKRLKKDVRPHLFIENPSNGKASGYLYTSRRGFYFVERSSYELKMTATRNKDGEYHIKAENMADINDIYFTKVDGMHLRPDKAFSRLREDLGLEQFLLREYPTPGWKSHVNSLKDAYGKEQIYENLEPPAKKQKIHTPLMTSPGRYGDIPSILDKGLNRYLRLNDDTLLDYETDKMNLFTWKDEWDMIL